MFFPCFVGVAEGEHFDFVELVDADDAGGVFAVGAGFAAETAGVTTITDGHFGFVEDLVGVEHG